MYIRIIRIKHAFVLSFGYLKMHCEPVQSTVPSRNANDAQLSVYDFSQILYEMPRSSVSDDDCRMSPITSARTEPNFMPNRHRSSSAPSLFATIWNNHEIKNVLHWDAGGLAWSFSTSIGYGHWRQLCKGAIIDPPHVPRATGNSTQHPV